MRLFKCSVCGAVRIYDQSVHSRISSLALDETDTSLAIWACSSECEKEAEKKLKSGEWEMPVLLSRQYYFLIKREQKGYTKQPDQMILKQEMNCANAQSSGTE